MEGEESDGMNEDGMFHPDMGVDFILEEEEDDDDDEDNEDDEMEGMDEMDEEEGVDEEDDDEDVLRQAMLFPGGLRQRLGEGLPFPVGNPEEVNFFGFPHGRGVPPPEVMEEMRRAHEHLFSRRFHHGRRVFTTSQHSGTRFIMSTQSFNSRGSISSRKVGRRSQRLLAVACVRGDAQAVQNGLSRGQGMNDKELVHISAQVGKTECLDVLCNAGIELDSPDQEGVTPLHLAVCCGNYDCVLLLLRHGVSPTPTSCKVPGRFGSDGRVLLPIHLASECSEDSMRRQMTTALLDFLPPGESAAQAIGSDHPLRGGNIIQIAVENSDEDFARFLLTRLRGEVIDEHIPIAPRVRDTRVADVLLRIESFIAGGGIPVSVKHSSVHTAVVLCSNPAELGTGPAIRAKLTVDVLLERILHVGFDNFSVSKCLSLCRLLPLNRDSLLLRVYQWMNRPHSEGNPMEMSMFYDRMVPIVMEIICEECVKDPQFIVKTVRLFLRALMVGLGRVREWLPPFPSIDEVQNMGRQFTLEDVPEVLRPLATVHPLLRDDPSILVQNQNLAEALTDNIQAMDSNPELLDEIIANFFETQHHASNGGHTSSSSSVPTKVLRSGVLLRMGTFISDLVLRIVGKNCSRNEECVSAIRAAFLDPFAPCGIVSSSEEDNEFKEEERDEGGRRGDRLMFGGLRVGPRDSAAGRLREVIVEFPPDVDIPHRFRDRIIERISSRLGANIISLEEVSDGCKVPEYLSSFQNVDIFRVWLSMVGSVLREPVLCSSLLYTKLFLVSNEQMAGQLEEMPLLLLRHRGPRSDEKWKCVEQIICELCAASVALGIVREEAMLDGERKEYRQLINTSLFQCTQSPLTKWCDEGVMKHCPCSLYSFWIEHKDALNTLASCGHGSMDENGMRHEPVQRELRFLLSYTGESEPPGFLSLNTKMRFLATALAPRERRGPFSGHMRLSEMRSSGVQRGEEGEVLPVEIKDVVRGMELESALQAGLHGDGIHPRNLRQGLNVQFVGDLGQGEGPEREFIRNVFSRNSVESFLASGNGILLGRLLAFCVLRRDVNVQELDGAELRVLMKEVCGNDVLLSDCVVGGVEVSKNMELLREMDDSALEMADIRFVNVDTGKPLVAGGENVVVRKSNVDDYIRLHIENSKHPSAAVSDVHRGISFLIDPRLLTLFRSIELVELVCGVDHLDVEDWERFSEYGNGYQRQSEVIQWFWWCVKEIFCEEERRALLTFAHGSSRVPAGGFMHLGGADGRNKFTILRQGDLSSCPTAHACINQLEMPPYDTKELLVKKLRTAIMECSGFGFI